MGRADWPNRIKLAANVNGIILECVRMHKLNGTWDAARVRELNEFLHVGPNVSGNKGEMSRSLGKNATAIWMALYDPK